MPTYEATMKFTFRTDETAFRTNISEWATQGLICEIVNGDYGDIVDTAKVISLVEIPEAPSNSFPQTHLGHHIGPVPTSKELGIENGKTLTPPTKL